MARANFESLCRAAYTLNEPPTNGANEPFAGRTNDLRRRESYVPSGERPRGVGQEWVPDFSSYCWWYSSAFQNRPRGPTAVVTCFFRAACSWSLAARATVSWAGERVKMALRYWSPTSGPWRFMVVGS